MNKFKLVLMVGLAANVLVACAELTNPQNKVYGQKKVTEQVIKINARKFTFSPDILTLRKGVPVILEFTSSDVIMGFNAPDLKSRVTIVPGKVTRIRIVPEKIGMFTFLCDVFCGSGHEDMTGTINVIG